MHRPVLIYLIIYTFFSWGLKAQNISLKIKGYNANETRIIDSIGYRTIHPNYLSIQSTTDSLQNTLYKIGYIENRIHSKTKTNDSTYNVLFQLKTRYDSIKIFYDASEIDSNTVKAISTAVSGNHFSINLENLETALQYINSKISNSGHPFSKVKLENISIDSNHELSAELRITNQSKTRYINKINIRGYNKFPGSYIKHYLKIKPNQVFNLTEIHRKTANLKNLRFANEVKSPEILFSKDSTTLYLYIEKKQSNTFDGFLGFGTNETTNNIDFDGYLNLNLTNNLNYGETFKLFYKSDENDQKTFETNLSLPYLFKSPIGLDFKLHIFRRDSSFTTTSQSAKIHYQINAKHKVLSGLQSLASNNLLENQSAVIDDYKTKYYTVGYEYLELNPDSALFPIISRLVFESNFGNRLQNKNKTKQTLYLLDGSKIFNLNNNNSIYLRSTSNLLNSKNYLENELLRFGGINSIRGFEENSLLASFFSVLNAEYRYQLNQLIYIHSVSDFAYFENKLTNTKEKLFGFGFGFGLFTKAGLFKLTYANGKNQKSTFKLSKSKVHLSLTARF